MAGAILAVVLLAAGAIWRQMRSERDSLGSGGSSTSSPAESVSASHPTVAVLPFQNLSGDDTTAYLSVAVPDEIISALSRVETLAVRPFASTAGYTTAPVDLAEVGATVRAVNLVTGQYFREGDQLSLTMEAVDVESNRLMWRDSIAVPAGDLLTLRQQVAAKVNAGLVSTLAPAATANAGATAPTNAEAYELFLRSLAVQHDPLPNKQALEMLERAVELDGGYARIWSELALRHHYDAQYAGGGQAALDREQEALTRALELDPYDLNAGEQQVVVLTDAGRGREALEIADALVGRHPQSGEAYFARSYVRRYASLIDEAIADCERALELDPTNYRWRSCANNFTLNGTYDRAPVFHNLDRGSAFFYDSSGHLYLSSGDIAAAFESWSHMPAEHRFSYEHELARKCAAGPLVAGDLQEVERSMASIQDGEVYYFTGAILAFCGELSAGLEKVRGAIERNYCATTGLEKERVWEPFRADPEFLETQRLAEECRDRFAGPAG